MFISNTSLLIRNEQVQSSWSEKAFKSPDYNAEDVDDHYVML